MTNQAPSMPRPLPVADDASRPFFDAAAEGRLMLRFCTACQRWLGYAADVCDVCFSPALEWKQASGRGKVYSFIIMHQVVHPGFASLTPYNVASVELEEGPRVHTNLLDIDNDQITMDMPVEVTFERLENDVTVPKFKPRT